MKTNSLFAKIAHGSVGLQGLLPNSAPANVVVEARINSETRQSDIKTIEKMVTEHVFSNDELLKKLEKQDLNLSQKTSLILRSLESSRPLSQSGDQVIEKDRKAQEISNQILNNTITPQEYYEKIKKIDNNITLQEVESMFSNIQASKQNEEYVLKNPLKDLEEIKTRRKRSTRSTENNPRTFSHNSEISLAENKYKTFESFYKNLRLQRRKTNQFATKTFAFAIISTSITIVAAGVAAAYTASAVLSLGATAGHAVAAWLQTGIMITFTALAWKEYYELIEHVKAIDGILNSVYVWAIKDYAKIFDKLKLSQPNESGSYKFKDLLNKKQIDEINGILSASDYLKGFLDDFVTEQAIGIIMDKVIEKKIMKYSERLIKNPAIRKIITKGSDLVTEFARLVLKQIYGNITRISSRLGAAILAKKALLLGTSWANPITQVLSVIDYLVTGIDLTTTLVLTFE